MDNSATRNDPLSPSVVAYDPMPSARARSVSMVPGLVVTETAGDAIEGADVVVLVTEWPEFVQLDWRAAGATMRRRVVVDGRNVLSAEELTASGFAYSSFGRGTFQADDGSSASLAATHGWSTTLQGVEG